jgi:preprotein translocase subunit SecE
MGDVANTSAEKTEKKGFFRSVKAEYKKIVWPNKESLLKQSVSVIVASIVLGAVIALLDLGIQYAIHLFL